MRTDPTSSLSTCAGPRLLAAGLVAALLFAACGDDGTGDEASSGQDTPSADAPVIDPGDGGNYEPQLDPADFVAEIDNPYLPLVPGSRWVYAGTSDGEAERIEVTVTAETREIEGITATVVRDTVFVDGELVEDTDDWYAQDGEGNVWYLGEDTKEYEDGEVVSTEGSWEYGVDGALPGIVMPADPTVGDAYRQEYLAGEAEDMGEVLRVGESVTVPAGSFGDCVVTEDWTPLEPDVVEHKTYAPGVGLVLEVKPGSDDRMELVEFTPGG